MITLRSISLTLALLALAGHAADVRIEGDRLTLHARNETIPAILAEFARQGVRVRLDPAVSASVTLRADRQDAETVLRAMLAEYDYIAYWRQVQGPLGPLPVLDELLVFRRGRREAVQPLPARPAAAAAGAAPRQARLEYAAGELLFRVQPGADPARILDLLARHGGRLADSIPVLGLYKAVFPPETDMSRLAGTLAESPLIAAAEPNLVYRLPAPPAGVVMPPGGGTPATARSGGPGAEPGHPLVAVLDTGFADPADPWVFWLDAATGAATPVDPNGHGTRMTLLASGQTSPLGVTPADATPIPVLAVRVSGADAVITGDALLRSVQAAWQSGARVINLSWGSETPSAFLRDTLQAALDRGLVVVAAAGNEPTGLPQYPAAFPGVLAVGAAQPDGAFAGWSNHGPFLSLAAPGYAPAADGRLTAGTSVSAAYTAHVLGAWFARHPDAAPADALRALQAALTDKGEPGWDAQYGFGLLDPAAVSRFLQKP